VRRFAILLGEESHGRRTQGAPCAEAGPVVRHPAQFDDEVAAPVSHGQRYPSSQRTGRPRGPGGGDRRRALSRTRGGPRRAALHGRVGLPALGVLHDLRARVLQAQPCRGPLPPRDHARRGARLRYAHRAAARTDRGRGRYRVGTLRARRRQHHRLRGLHAHRGDRHPRRRPAARRGRRGGSSGVRRGRAQVDRADPRGGRCGPGARPPPAHAGAARQARGCRLPSRGPVARPRREHQGPGQAHRRARPQHPTRDPGGPRRGAVRPCRGDRGTRAAGAR